MSVRATNGDHGNAPDAVPPAPTAREEARWRWFWPAVLAICVAGGVQRFLLRAEYLADDPFSAYPTVDALTYWNWAGRIAAGHLSDGTPFFSAPLYPYLLGLLRACGGELGTVYAIQILFDLATAVLLACIARVRFGAAVGVLAAVVFLLMLEPASFCLRVLTSSLQLPLICLAWLAMIAAHKRRSWARGVAAGAAIGLLALAYPPAMFCLPVFGVWWWLNTGRSWVAFGRATVAVAAGLAVISPATIHNYYVSGELFPIQSALGINFRQGNGPGARGVITMIPGTSQDREALFRTAQRDFRAKHGRDGTWKEIDHYYRAQALDYWREDPARAVKLFAQKAYWFLTGRNYGDIYLPTLEQEEGLLTRLRFAPLHTAWLIPPALVAIAVWMRRLNTHAPGVMLFGVPLAVVVVFWFSPRYRLPAIPVIVVAATWAIWQALHWRTRTRWTVAVAASLAVAFGLGAVNRWKDFDTPDFVRPVFESTLAGVRVKEGKLEEARTRYRKALELQPNLEPAGLGLANVYRLLGQVDEARRVAERVLELSPDSPEAHDLLGMCLVREGRVREATAHFERAVELDPGDVQALTNLGSALALQGRLAEAETLYRRALRINPGHRTAWFSLGLALAGQGKSDEAVEAFRRTLQVDPTFAAARRQLAQLLVSGGRYAEAVETLRAGCRAVPDDVATANDLAWLLATCPQADVRDGVEAVRLAEKACRATQHPSAAFLDTLAAAYAEAGQFDRAVETARRAVEAATAGGDAGLAQRITRRLTGYESHTPYRAEHVRP